jgi:hypothetical protein
VLSEITLGWPIKKAAFLDDSIFSPPLLPRMLTKPRTVCGCQPVAFMISGRVAPLARFIIAMTSAFLLARSAFGFAAAFLALRAPLAGFAESAAACRYSRYRLRCRSLNSP